MILLKDICVLRLSASVNGSRDSYSERAILLGAVRCVKHEIVDKNLATRRIRIDRNDTAKSARLWLLLWDVYERDSVPRDIWLSDERR